MYRITVKVEGMMCQHCEARVAGALKERFGGEATADHGKNAAVMTAEKLPEESEVRAVIEDNDYTYGGMTAEEL